MFTCVFGRYVASTVLSVPNLSEGADRVGGQLRGSEWPFSGVTKSCRVWRKVPENDARSVGLTQRGGVSVSESASDTRNAQKPS